MKQRVVFHYLLFLAIIFGAFASMAQNNYGLTIVTTACYLFSVSLLIEVIQKFNSSSWDKVVELLGLVALFILFGLRATYIHFLHVERLLILICATLIVIYIVHGTRKSKALGKNNLLLRNLVILYYASLIGFTLSIIIATFTPPLIRMTGGISTALLFIFILGLIFSKTQMINGVEIKITEYLLKQAGHSTILMTGYLLITLYSGLYIINVLPPLYTNKIPQVYIELINESETGQKTTVDGKYKHELYKEAYDNFVNKHCIED